MVKYVLEILDGDRAGEVLPVPDGALRIGRKPANDLVLADEKTSGVHAEIVMEGDRHVLRDLGSTNGTFLDGKRVTEIVLSVGDVVTIGRLRVRFGDDSEPAAGSSDSEELSMHRLDAGRLQKRGSPVALIALLVLVAGGVGGYFWWDSQQQNAATPGVPAAEQKAALVVSGNKLPGDVGNCEAPDGWNLGAHGLAFQASGLSNSGKGALEALRVEGNDTDYAIASPTEPVAVLSGRSLTIAAHLRTEGKALAGVRAVFSQSRDETGLLRFRSGSAIAAHAGWERVEVQLAVPPGCDQLTLEVVALLPDGDSVAYVDDVAVTEAGAAEPTQITIEEGGQTATGTGCALFVQSAEVTLAGLAPSAVPAAFRQLHAADLCVLSDLGASLTATAEERHIALAVSGGDVTGMRFVFPADAAGQVLARRASGGPFASVAAAGNDQLVELLVGGKRTRVLLRTAAPCAVTRQLGGGLYRVDVAATEVDFVVGFRAQKQQGGELFRQASARRDANDPAAALALLDQLQQEAPHSSEVLREASTLRGEILAGLDDRVAALQRDLNEAEFFDTRGGFARVRAGVERLHELYGEAPMQARPVAAELRDKANARLAALDAEQQGAELERLQALANAFTKAGQPELAKLVADYTENHLSAEAGKD